MKINVIDGFIGITSLILSLPLTFSIIFLLNSSGKISYEFGAYALLLIPAVFVVIEAVMLTSLFALKTYVTGKKK